MKYNLRKGLYLLMAILCVGWAQAETKSVSTLADLRDAIGNSKITTITLGANIEVTDGTAITISRALTLDGAGLYTISGTVATAILEITGTEAVTIKNLTVANNHTEESGFMDISVKQGSSTDAIVTFENVNLGGNTPVGIYMEGAIVSIQQVVETGTHQYGINLEKNNTLTNLKIKGTDNHFDKCVMPIICVYGGDVTVETDGSNFTKLPIPKKVEDITQPQVWTDRYNSSTYTYTIKTEDRDPAFYSEELGFLSGLIAIATEDAYQKIVLGAGEFDLSCLSSIYEKTSFEITKSLTIEGAGSGENGGTKIIGQFDVLLPTDAANTTALRPVIFKNLTIEGATGINGLINVMSENVGLSLEGVTLHQKSNFNNGDYWGTTAKGITICNPNYNSNDNPDNISITMKLSSILMDGKYNRGISYAGNTSNKPTGIQLTLIDSEIKATVNPDNATYGRGISLYGQYKPVVILNNSKVLGFYYPINLSANTESNVTIENNCDIQGYGPLNIWDSNAHITVKGSSLTGRNYYQVGSSDFATVVINKGATNNTLLFEDATISAVQTNTAVEYLFAIRSTGNTISLKGNTTLQTKTNDLPVLFDYYNESYIYTANVSIDPTVTFKDKDGKDCILVYDDNGNFRNAVIDLSNCLYYPITDGVNTALLPTSFDDYQIVIPAGTYELSEQLVVDYPVTIKGAGIDQTIIKATAAEWTTSQSFQKNLVSIEDGTAGQTVTLKDLTISNSQRSGLNVQTAMNTVLNNVKLADNKSGAGMIVHSPVTAYGLITEGNGWGGVNVDKGNPLYTISLTVDANCVFNDYYPIYSDDATEASAGYVTTPTSEQWTNGIFKTIASKPDTNGKFASKQKRVWSEDLIVEVSANDEGINIYANGKPVTVSDGEDNTTEFSIGDENNGSSIALPTAWNLSLYGGAKNASVTSTNITMESGTIKDIFGGGYAPVGSTPTADVTESATITINGGTITNILQGGGKYLSKVPTVNLTSTNADIAYLMLGGYDAGATGNTIDTPLAESNNGVGTITATITGGKISSMGCGGGQGYSRTGTSTVSVSGTEIGSLYGTYSNGRAESINATFTNCTITQNLAAINRGKIDEASFTFKECSFGDSMSASVAAIEGWADSDTNGKPEPTITNKVVWKFLNSKTATPTMLVGRGTETADIELVGAPAKMNSFRDGAAVTGNTTAYTINAGKTWSFDRGLSMEEGTTLTIKDNAKLITPETTALAEVTIEKDAQIANGELTANKLRTTVNLTDKKWKAYGFPAAFQLVSKDEKKTTYDKPSEQAAATGAWIAGLSANKLPFTYNTAFDEQGGLLAATDGDYYVESTEKVTLKETKPTTPAAGTFQLFANPTLADMELSGVYFYTLDATNNQFLPYDSTEPYILQPFETVLLTDAETFQTLRSVGIGEGGATANEWIAKEGYYLTTERGAIVVHTAEPMELYVVAVSGAVVYRGTAADGERIVVPTGFYAVNGQIVRVK